MTTSIRKIYFIFFYFILYFSSAFADNLEPYDEFDEVEQSTTSSKRVYAQSKQKNFRDYITEYRIANLYLDSLVTYLLDSNQAILKDKNIKNSDLCFRYLTDDFSYEYGFYNINGDIVIAPTVLTLDFINSDAAIIAILVHEVSHSIARDFYQKRDLKRELNKIPTTLPKEKYQKAYKEQEQKITQYNKDSEIFADNLGLQLYLNTGLDLKIYEEVFLHYSDLYFASLKENKKDNEESFYSTLSDEDYDFYRSVSNSENCIKLGNTAIKDGEFDAFMSKIKYIPHDSYSHPTHCWRYWNVHQQILERGENIYKTHDIINISYLKLDLNKYKFLYSKDWEDSLFDPKISLDKFLKFDNDIDIYDVDLTVKNRTDINFIKEDNTLILNLFDIVKVIADLNYKNYKNSR